MKRLSFGLTIVICGMSAAPVWGQSAIVPDSTLGASNSTIQETTIRGLPSTLIQGGSSQGANLFHSFLRFNVPVGRGAYFANPDGIKNIFSRVTGAERSEIFGRLGVLGDANLFLMNPNGILFGQTGSLDVNGSFVATTANAIQFGDRGSFDTTNPPNSVLTIDPSAFLFTQVPIGKIVNRSIAPAGTTLGGSPAFGLWVPDGKNLLLVGGDIEIDGGSLNALGGRIELAALAALGKVVLNQERKELILKLSEGSTRGDIALRNGAIATVRTLTDGGNLVITSRNVSLSEDSQILAGILQGQDSAHRRAGDITINATNTVDVKTGSRIRNTVSAAQGGNSGNINITANSLFLSDNARLDASTFGKGDAGNIIIQAKDRISLNNQSLVSSRVAPDAIGQAGNIVMKASTINVNSSSQLNSATSGQGDAGNIDIEAKESLSIKDSIIRSLSSDGKLFVLNNGIFSNVEKDAVGQGGDIRIRTNLLELQNGALIKADTAGMGNAGSVMIDAQDRIISTSRIRAIRVSDRTGRLRIRNVISSSVESTGIGNAGDVHVSTDRLELFNGTDLLSYTSGTGDAGDIIVNVRNLATFDFSFAKSGIASESGMGQGGNIRISTPALELRNGAQFDASTFGKGEAGDININVSQSVLVAGAANSFDGGYASAIFSTTGDANNRVGTGAGGNINIKSPLLIVGTGGIIDARTFNNKQGGNINLDVRRLEILNGGQIFTTSIGSGTAGTITINASESVTIAGTDSDYFRRVEEFGDGRVGAISERSILSVFSDSEGAAGNIIVNAPQITIQDQGIISAESRASDGGNINLSADRLLLRRQGSISATAGLAAGAGNGGNININAQFIVAIPKENSDIIANAFQGSGGKIVINSQGIFGLESRTNLTALSDITASSNLGVTGTIAINAPDNGALQNGLAQLIQNSIDTNTLLAKSCIVRDRATGAFFIKGTGGLPLRPGDLALAPFPTGNIQPTQQSNSEIVEPQGIYQLADGRYIMSRECQ